MADLELEMEDGCRVSSGEEHRGLLYGNGVSKRATPPIDTSSSSSSRTRRGRHHLPTPWRTLSSLTVLCCLLIFCWKPGGPPSRTTTGHDKDRIFGCPAAALPATTTTENGKDKKLYDRRSQQILANVTGYMDTFRKAEYDGWNRTYAQVKESMYDWKSKHYADLSDGGSIFESACGIGMNLFMTLEILAEVRNLQNVKVYGNEYVQESIDVANVLLETVDWPGHASPGAICPGDSTSMPFVPSDSFDVVFTGYLTPLHDPLELGDEDKGYIRQTALCSAPDSNVEAKRLVRLIQERQEAWYAKWLSEMIRIAKPGAPVIAEQISYPLCDSPGDWGGVEQDFWRRAIETYPQWDVDPTSLYIERDSLFEGEYDRYHVFMRKSRRPS